MDSGLFSEQFIILPQDCDREERLKYSSLFSYMQKTASDQCDSLGCGRDRLVADFGVCYVIVRMTVSMERIPSTGETITVTTWPESRLRLSFKRYFTYRDETGARIGSAVSSWVLMNLNTRKIVSPASVGLTSPDTSDNMPPFDEGRFAQPEDFISETVTHRIPVCTDFDNNGHVNNAKYLDWTFDALSFEERAVSSVDIQYRSEIQKESTCGADIILRTNENGFYVIIKSGETVNTECKGEFVK